MQETCLRDMLEYDAWATARFIARCSELAPGELSAPTGIGRGTIAIELEHLVNSPLIWNAVLSGGALPQRPPADHEPAPPAELSTVHEELHARFRGLAAKAIDEGHLADTLTLPGNVVISASIGIMHAIDHAAYHRAEIECMLQVLHLPAPERVSVVGWSWSR